MHLAVLLYLYLIYHLSTQDAVLDVPECIYAEASVYDTDETRDVSSIAIQVMTVMINAPMVVHNESPNGPFSARSEAARVITSFMSTAIGFLFF